MRAFAFAYLVLFAQAAGGCDSSAKANANPQPTSDRQLSRVGESCGSSMDCLLPARCLEQVCRGDRASTLGDLYAAVGELALEQEQLDPAINAFAQAVSRYEEDGVEPPSSLYCAQGHALAIGRSVPARAELAARVLHRCVISEPPGTERRRAAMRDLALLLEVGLDASVLARTEPADVYITQEKHVPDVDAVTVQVTTDGRKPSSRTYRHWAELLGTEPIRRALAPCWTAHFKATRHDSVTVKLEAKYGYKLDQYDDFDRSTLTLEEPPSGDDPAAVTTRCIREALVPIAEEYAKGAPESNWKTGLVITLAQQ